MSEWGKIYPDGILHDRKFKLLSDAAQALWFRSWCLCVRDDTKGHLHRGELTELRGTAKTAAEIVASGLWVEVADGWELLNFEKWNPFLAEDHAERKSTAADAGRLGMHRRHHLNKGITKSNCPYCVSGNPYVTNLNETDNEPYRKNVTEYRNKNITISLLKNAKGDNAVIARDNEVTNLNPADAALFKRWLTTQGIKRPAAYLKALLTMMPPHWWRRGIKKGYVVLSVASIY